MIYNRFNREELSQVLSMYDAGSQLLSGIKGMYVNDLGCVRVEGGERVFQDR